MVHVEFILVITELYVVIGGFFYVYGSTMLMDSLSHTAEHKCFSVETGMR